MLTAFESRIENVDVFLTESVMPQQLEILSGLKNERHCDTVGLF